MEGLPVEQDDTKFVVLWILIFLGFVGAFRYARTGETTDILVGEVQDCHSLPGRGTGSFIALVDLEDGEQVKILSSGCFKYVGKSMQVAKKKSRLSGEVIFVFTDEL